MEQDPPRFRDRRTERFACGERVKTFEGFRRQAEKRLTLLEEVTMLKDLMVLPSNGFEALGGDRKGQFSIRINHQWRICFDWPEWAVKPFNIEITDYH